jgi:hypothetical protein
VILVLLLEVRQSPRAGPAPVGRAAHVRADRGLDPFGLPSVGLQVIPAHHDILSSLPARHRRAEVYDRAANYTAGRSRS